MLSYPIFEATATNTVSQLGARLRNPNCLALIDHFTIAALFQTINF